MLALVGEAYGGRGGIAQYNRDLFGALAGLGDYSIEVLPRHGAPRVATPAMISQSHPTFGRAPYGVRAMAAALRGRPDVIFCGHLFMAPLASLLARMAGGALVIQTHGIEAWPTPGELVRRAVARADLVLCVSRDTRKKLLAWSDLAPERVVVLPNTVGEAFTPGDRAKARAKFSLGDTPVMLSVGRLSRREQYKGQDRVIAALPALNAAGLAPLYLIAGDGDDRGRLEALADTAGVADQVRFLGQVADEHLPDLYRAADLFVLPSTGEGFGIVFLEAMACGAPALGLNAGGAADALCDGELGAAVDEADFTQALTRLLSAPRSPDLPGRVERRFGAAAFASRVEAVIGRLDNNDDGQASGSATQEG